MSGASGGSADEVQRPTAEGEGEIFEMYGTSGGSADEVQRPTAEGEDELCQEVHSAPPITPRLQDNTDANASWVSLPEYDSVRAPSKIASLDFELVVNSFSIQATKERLLVPVDEAVDGDNFTLEGGHKDHGGYKTFQAASGRAKKLHRHVAKEPWRGNTSRTFFRWVLTILTGVLTGAATIFILVSTEYFVSLRLSRLNKIETASQTAAEDAVFATYHKKYKPSSNYSSFYHEYLFRAYARVFVDYALLNLVLALTSCALCLYFAPEAVGSGIPESIAYLNGVRVRKFSDFLLFLVKIVGTILSVSSSLAIGPEGPLVHLGCIVGASLTKSAGLEKTVWKARGKWERTMRRIRCQGFAPRTDSDSPQVDGHGESIPLSESWQSDANTSDDAEPGCCWNVISNMLADLSHFRNDAERRDLISIGAATGFAAAFGAPVGGVLFSLEEASTFFAHTLLWRTLTATATATFCLAAFRGDLSEYGVISLTSYAASESGIFINRVVEIPFYVATGLIGGLLGAGFNVTWRRMQKRRMTFFEREHLSTRARAAWRLLEVGLLSLLTSGIMFCLPLLASWSCRAINATASLPAQEDVTADPTDNDDDLDFDHQLDCGAAQVNELGVIFFGSREEAIKSILADPSKFDTRTLLTVGLVFFPLMLLTFGVALPSGIFMPTILVGSALGGCAGIFFKDFLSPEISPSTFALLGAAALLAGIQRNVVSLCVILVEGTGQTKVLIPVIITVVVARYIGDRFTHGIYHIAMELKGYPYLDHHVKAELVMFSVKDIMTSPVRTLRPIESVGTIEKFLLRSSHHGFPVIDQDTGKFLGLIRRDQLVALLQCGIFVERGSEQSRSHRRKRSSVNNPFMNLAFHIKDDRFNSLDSDDEDKALVEDDFDEHAWFVDNIHSSFRVGKDDALPHTRALKARSRKTVVAKEDGKLVVFPDDAERQLRVDIGAAMNQGAYCVTESVPVSKAYEMFTTLGLRHLVVLGGAHGGEVVGILTRSNFDESFMEEHSGIWFRKER